MGRERIASVEVFAGISWVTWLSRPGTGGGLSASIVVPFDFALLGTTVHFQGFAFEPLVGSLTTSNALSSTFGIR